MKGEAKSLPSNHVEWVNGFKSNMPDWQTARHCAIADEMLGALKSCRTLLLAIGRPGAFNDSYDEELFENALKRAMSVIERADGFHGILENEAALTMTASFPVPSAQTVKISDGLPLERLKHHVTGAIERGEKTAIKSIPMPPPPGFPKPPGVE